VGIFERREREKESRRAAIVESAEELFFDRGYERTKMADIAGRAELSKGALYLYFRTKEDLARAIVVRSYDVLIDLLKTERDKAVGGRAQAEALLQAFMRFYQDRYRNLYLTLVLEGYLRGAMVENDGWPEYFDRIEEIRVIAADVLRAGIAEGAFSLGMDPDRVAITVMTAAAGFLHRVVTFGHIMRRDDYAPEEMMDQLFVILKRALL